MNHLMLEGILVRRGALAPHEWLVSSSFGFVSDLAKFRGFNTRAWNYAFGTFLVLFLMLRCGFIGAAGSRRRAVVFAHGCLLKHGASWEVCWDGAGSLLGGVRADRVQGAPFQALAGRAAGGAGDACGAEGAAFVAEARNVPLFLPNFRVTTAW